MHKEDISKVNDNFNDYRDRIANFSNDFEVGLFIFILKKNLFLVVSILITCITIALTYLHYTPSVYQSRATLQIQKRDNAKKVLNVDDIYDESSLTAETELLKSDLLIKRTAKRLPLSISYFEKGEILNTQLYPNTNFTVNILSINDSSIFDIPLYINFLKDGKFEFSLAENKVEGVYETNKICKTKTITFTIEINDREIIESVNSGENTEHFFVVNSLQSLSNFFIQSLSVDIANQTANTVIMSSKMKNPQLAKDFLMAHANEYISFDLETKEKSSKNILQFIDSQLDTVYENLRESELSLNNYKKENRINNLDNVSTLYFDYFKQYEEEELEIQVNDNLLKQVEETIQKSKSELDIYAITPLLSGSNYENSISEMLLKLRDLLLQKEELLFQVTPKNSGSKSIDYAIQIQKNIIVESISSLRNKLQNRKVYLNEKLSKYDAQINSLPTKELEFARLQRLFNINEKYYTLLLEKKTEYRISKEGFVAETRILEEANLPNSPISPNKSFIVSSFLLAGVLLSIILITLKYIFHNNITSLNEISKISKSSIGVLGIIPKYRQEIPVSQLLIDKNPKSLISEAFRNIRTNLDFMNSDPGAKVIAITSTVAGEGKTFVAINLAGIIAFTGKKVIIIDLDMRKPKIHIGFGATNFNGMSTILINKDTIANCIQKSSLSGLDFITAGPIPPNPAELIISKKMDVIIEELKLLYDIIVIDNSPVGLVTDGISIIQKADFPIYIFRADYSKKQYVQIVDRLKNENKFSKLSVVLNSVDTERSKYGYNSGYGYGYGYGYMNQGYYDEPPTETSHRKNSFFWKKN